MKKTIKFFGVLLFASCIVTACNSDYSGKSRKTNTVDDYLENAEYAKDHNVYTDAISYNAAIVGIQTKIMTEVLKLDGSVANMRKQLGVIQEETKIALTTTNKIYYSGDTDENLKKAVLKLFNFYDKIFTEDYVAVLDLRDITDNEEDFDIANAAYLEMNEIVEKFSAEEYILDDEFEAAQKRFASENGIIMDSAAHPLQDEIDELVYE
jgi:hypothetical protein